MATLIVDAPLTGQDDLRRRVEVWLRLYEVGPGQYIGVATDLNTGPSVTNAVDAIWAAVRTRHLPNGAALTAFEHYDGTPGDPSARSPDPEVEHYDRVVLGAWDAQRQRHAGHAWAPGTQAEIERLIGGPLAPLTAPSRYAHTEGTHDDN